MPSTTEPGSPEERCQAAKHPVSMVAGPHGQPFHPLLASIPFGAWVISFAFDLAAHFAHEEVVYSRAAFWLIGIGIVSAIPAGVTGTLDLLNVARNTQAFRTGVTHMVLNNIILVAFVVSFLLRRGTPSTEAAELPLMALSVAALALLAASGWLGVRLIYRYGVRVVDEATQAEGFQLLTPTADAAPAEAAPAEADDTEVEAAP